MSEWISTVTKVVAAGVVAAVAALASGSAFGADAATCKSLTATDFGQVLDAPTRLSTADVISARAGVPAYCKASGYVATNVGVEIRLPMSAWNGKLLFTGCGAMCGTMLGAAACDDAVARGYACATTDMGHRGLPYDGKWAYNNPIAETDLGHRATHVAAVAAKAIITAFYGADIDKSYYRGCSTGGRQGLIAAQRYPYDFDGIIAGSPVLYQLMGPPLQLFWGVTANLDTNGDPILSERKLPALAKAALDACDAVDGLKDGLIDAPMECDFDPSVLRCSGAPDDNCLTDAEIAVVKKMYDGPPPPEGKSFAPLGMLPGSELNWGGYFRGGKQSPNYGFAGELLRYLVFADDPGPSYEPTMFDWQRDPQRLNLSVQTAANPDLSLFRDGGGKLIIFHGLADSAIMASSTTSYFDMVTRTMGGAEATGEFAKLYLPAGLGHCTGGPGLNTVDFLTALENWVERGEGPDGLTAYNIENTQPVATLPVGFKPSQAKFARPVFPYPARAVYDGSGDWKDPRNFTRGSSGD
ncbi:MAG: tannase/feruloyl esterase family alpha/beta hydrolase [Rhodobacteraceae bacterium]|nr:tannase/feruloyl esterase family alpha/beta hydrolase [Paracoccaceae bacterium]